MKQNHPNTVMSRETVGSSAKPGDPSILQQLMDVLMADSRFSLRFEDLSGICQDIETLHLPAVYHSHNSSFCELARIDKRDQGRSRCQRNRDAINRLAARRREPFIGRCHLGLTEIVYPLLIDGILLGVFLCGSVVLRGTEESSRERIRRHAIRTGTCPSRWLEALGDCPHVTQTELSGVMSRLEVLARITKTLVQASGYPIRNYRPYASQRVMEKRRQQPAIVRMARWHIARHLNEPLTVRIVAEWMRCHPDYLSRKFKECEGISLHEYIIHARLNRARQMLRSSDCDVGQIGFETGFRSHSHFTKVFRLHVGMTPSDYRDQLASVG